MCTILDSHIFLALLRYVKYSKQYTLQYGISILVHLPKRASYKHHDDDDIMVIFVLDNLHRIFIIINNLFVCLPSFRLHIYKLSNVVYGRVLQQYYYRN